MDGWMKREKITPTKANKIKPVAIATMQRREMREKKNSPSL